MPKRLARQVRHVSFVLPTALHKRLVRRAAKETADLGRTVTQSEIIRVAVEEYLDMYETATFVPGKAEDRE